MNFDTRSRCVLLSALALITVLSCDENPVCIQDPIAIGTGRVLYIDTMSPAEGCRVIMAERISNSSHQVFHDTVTTNSRGVFQFNNIPDGVVSFFAWETDDIDTTEVSHKSPHIWTVRYPGEEIAYAGDLHLHEVSSGSTVQGTVMSDLPVVAPIEGALVKLFGYDGFTASVFDSAITDVSGLYSFEGVPTGSYYAYVYVVDLGVDETPVFFCDGVETFQAPELVPVIYCEKPAIYIYPESGCEYSVRLSFNNGSFLTKSIPEYGDGWEVFVDESGRIDKEYDYLFYEASLSEFQSPYAGWSISRDDLRVQLAARLIEIGLNRKETDDFMEYWHELLQGYAYYNIYPIFNDAVDRFVGLSVAPEPESILRVWVIFEGCDSYQALPAPTVPFFERGASTVVEWGGIQL